MQARPQLNDQCGISTLWERLRLHEPSDASTPEFLQPFKKTILRLAGRSRQQEVRWHMAQIIPRLQLTSKERAVAVDLLFDYLTDKSKIVVTFSLQALSELAVEDQNLRPRVVEVLKALSATGSPAIKNRSQKLLQKLSKI